MDIGPCVWTPTMAARGMLLWHAKGGRPTHTSNAVATAAPISSVITPDWGLLRASAHPHRVHDCVLRHRQQRVSTVSMQHRIGNHGNRSTSPPPRAAGRGSRRRSQLRTPAQSPGPWVAALGLWRPLCRPWCLRASSHPPHEAVAESCGRRCNAQQHSEAPFACGIASTQIRSA